MPVGAIGPADESRPGSGTATANATADDSYLGMPRRVRQANLAPQLRGQQGTGTTPAQPDASAGPTRSPEEASAMLSELQAGWLRGRIDDLD